MKQEFEMTQAEMDSIIAINKNTEPIMMIGSYVSGMNLQEKINNYWVELGNKYGFKHLTVEGSSKGKLFFLAEPKPIEIPKTQTEKEVEKYLGNSLSYLSRDVRGACIKIVTQLEGCGYENEAGILINNIAFLALKKLAGL